MTKKPSPLDKAGSYYVIYLPEITAPNVIVKGTSPAVQAIAEAMSKPNPAKYLTDDTGRIVWYPSRALAELHASRIDWRKAEVKEVE